MSLESFALNVPLSHFSHALIAWQQQSGRHNLPWQQTDPYLVWVSEIMLQQTQVSTVLDYYPRIIARFPDVQTLADAPIDDVTALWAGLGYYSRARNLHHAAQQVRDEFAGTFPHQRTELESLKGVGRSTAAASRTAGDAAAHVAPHRRVVAGLHLLALGVVLRGVTGVGAGVGRDFKDVGAFDAGHCR